MHAASLAAATDRWEYQGRRERFRSLAVLTAPSLNERRDGPGDARVVNGKSPSPELSA
jgi:hypothetical protein